MVAATILSSEVVSRGKTTYGVVTVQSQSNPLVSYRVDFTNQRCSCPAWTRSKPRDNGTRPLCKHLKSLGYVER